MLFSNVILRLGEMLMLMSYVDSIGSLMADSGVTELMQAAFAGVPKMLSGKKATKCTRLAHNCGGVSAEFF